jgi:hypothetical protein
VLKKLALISIKVVGLSSVGGNPKNTMRRSLLPLKGFRRRMSGSYFGHGVPAKRKGILRILFVWGNMWLTPIRISG